MRYRTHSVMVGATAAQLTATIAELRADQRRAVIPSTAAEIGVDIDAHVDALLLLTPVP